MTEPVEQPNYQIPMNLSMPTPPGMTPGMEIVAYRLSMVESEVSGLDKKLDKIAQTISDNYISNKTLELILNPFTSRIDELEKSKIKEGETKAADQRQLKLIMIAAGASALFSPVGAALVALILSSK